MIAKDHLKAGAERWNAVVALQRRERRGLFFGPGLYVTIFIALIASVLLLRNHLAYAEDNGVAVMSRPLIIPFFFSIVLASTYLALVSTTSIAREREQGTLEVLFYGPIDDVAYVVGKFATPLLACAAVVLLDLLWALLFARLTNFLFSFDLILVALLALASGAAIVAFSILVSTMTRSARTAVIVFLLVAGVFAAIQGGHEALSFFAPAPEANRLSPMFFLRDTLAVLNHVAEWLSPFAYLSRGIDALVVGDWMGYISMIGLAVLSTGVFLILATRMLARQGVRA